MAVTKRHSASAGRFILGLALVLFAAARGTAASLSPPPFHGASGQFTVLSPGDPEPETAISTLSGGAANLAQLRGRVVVLNFWATWCQPCVYEMPSLDRLADRADPKRLAVVAVSVDSDDAAAVASFVAARHLTHLSVYLDPSQRLGALHPGQVRSGALPLWGLPITYVIDARGHVVGYLIGAANWDSPEALNFLDYFMRSGNP